MPADTLAIGRFFLERTGLRPQFITAIRQPPLDPKGPVAVWSILTQEGHFYVVDGRSREIYRAQRNWRAEDAYRRYLELHPEDGATLEPAAGGER
ncbi:MAG: hypothetical protein HY690_17420 [Chloroflexi bacterium]|nr:hypothetical protein [Chloroflexota bacterium]